MWRVHDSADGSLKPVLPDDATVKAVRLVTFTKDQGSTGMSGFWFLLASRYNIACKWDWFHRLKNDIFNACKRVNDNRGDIFKSILECALVMNLKYSPFGTGEWHDLRQEALASYILEHTADSPCFLEYCDRIAAQFGLESNTREEREVVFQALASMQSFQQKGPCTKLKRFMSVNEGWDFYKYEFWGNKLVLNWLLHMKGMEACPADEDAPRENVWHKEHREELQKAKRDKGTLKIAPSAITQENINNMNIHQTACNHLWHLHGRSRMVFLGVADGDLLCVSGTGCMFSIFACSECLRVRNLCVFGVFACS